MKPETRTRLLDYAWLAFWFAVPALIVVGIVKVWGF